MSRKVRVYLAGEGTDDIGNAAAPLWQQAPARPGVVQTLLERIAPDGWDILGATTWKAIAKYKAGQHRTAEQRNVLGLALKAAERGAEVIAFVRDRDGDRDRHRDVEAGIQLVAAGDALRTQLEVIGGVAVEEVESWVLAALGVFGSESLTDPKSVLRDGHALVTCEDKVAALSDCDLANLPHDAVSLRTWLTRARKVAAQGFGA